MRLVDGGIVAKERVRGAASRLFGRDGYAATTMPAVATAAGARPGFVAAPSLGLHANGLYADDCSLLGALDALARTSGPHSDKGENDPNQDPDPPYGARS